MASRILKFQVRRQQMARLVATNGNRIVVGEEHSQTCNLDIKEVPVETEEKLTILLKTLSELNGEATVSAVINVCHRLPVTNSPSNVNTVIQFICYSKRNAILEKARRMTFSRNDLGIRKAQVPIHVNEDVCP